MCGGGQGTDRPKLGPLGATRLLSVDGGWIDSGVGRAVFCNGDVEDVVLGQPGSPVKPSVGRVVDALAACSRVEGRLGRSVGRNRKDVQVLQRPPRAGPAVFPALEALQTF
jgi:hypothetical protein